MKDIKNFLVNESKMATFICAFSGLNDEEDLPISCQLLVDAKYTDKVLEFAQNEEGNVFVHFGDENEEVTY